MPLELLCHFKAIVFAYGYFDNGKRRKILTNLDESTLHAL